MARARIIDPNAEELELEPRQAKPDGGTEGTLDAKTEDVLLGDDVPEQYRGKKARDMLQVAQNQASLIGRQSQEVGQLREEARRLRELVDREILTRTRSADDRGEHPTELTREDYWEKPREAVSRVVSEETKADRDRLARLEYNQRRDSFNSVYKTAGQDVNDPDFVAYVEKSQRRQRLAQKAFKDLQNIDFDAAEELWESWSEFKELKGTTTVASKQPEDTQPSKTVPLAKGGGVTPAPSLKGGGGGDPDESGGTPSGRQWTEAELLKMQDEKPDDYWALAASGEIDRAWREQRVKRQQT